MRRLGAVLGGALVALAVHAGAAAQAGAKEATLTVANRPVVTFRVAYNGADPESRVARAQARLGEARERGLGTGLVLVPVDLEGRRGIALRTGDIVLFTVVEGDVEPGGGATLAQTADRARARLATALQAQAAQHRWPVLLRGIGLSLAATLALLVALWACWRMHAALMRRMAPPADPAQAGVTRYVEAVLKRISQLVVLFVSAGLAFLWLDFVLFVFPATEPVSLRLSGLLMDAAAGIGAGVVASIPGLIVVAVILLLAQALVEASNAVFRAIARRELSIPRIHPETASATRRLTVLVIWACALVAAYPYLPGSNSDVFKGLSVLIGAMVTLGTTGIVNQLMSGLVLVYSRALRTGDYVVIGEQEGVVAEVGTLATKLVTMRNEQITIPNAVLVSSPIRNYSKLSDVQGTLVSTRVTIGYDAPWRKVHALLLEAAGSTTGLRAAPAPYVLQRALSDFYVEYELFASIDKPLERLIVLSALHANIQDAFNAAGVQIMSPHFVEQPSAPVVARAAP